MNILYSLARRPGKGTYVSLPQRNTAGASCGRLCALGRTTYRRDSMPQVLYALYHAPSTKTSIITCKNTRGPKVDKKRAASIAVDSRTYIALIMWQQFTGLRVLSQSHSYCLQRARSKISKYEINEARTPDPPLGIKYDHPLNN